MSTLPGCKALPGRQRSVWLTPGQRGARRRPRVDDGAPPRVAPAETGDSARTGPTRSRCANQARRSASRRPTRADLSTGGRHDGTNRRSARVAAWPLPKPSTGLRGSSSPTSRSSITARSARARTRVLEAQRELARADGAEPVRFLGRELEGHLDEAPRCGRRVPQARTPRASRSCPTRRPASRPCCASLRFQPGDELLTTDHEYNATLNALRSVAERAGARVVVVADPVPDPHDPDEARRGDPGRGDAADPARARQPRHQPDRARLPDRARSCASSTARGIDTLVDGAHAPGMVALDLGALGARVLDRQRPQVAVRPKGSGFLHVRADRRDAIRPLVDLARRQRRRGRPLALPARVRLDRAPPTRRPTSRCPPRSGSSGAFAPAAGRR